MECVHFGLIGDNCFGPVGQKPAQQSQPERLLVALGLLYIERE